MGFVAVCVALYDYQPQSEEELELKEGELLYILEKEIDDDWWKAKKKADGDDDEEPEGLIPYNYVEAVKPHHQARALYDYSRQTDEEVSFEEDVTMDVYDTSDSDWTLVGTGGEFGFAPANYIELVGDKTISSMPASPVQAGVPPIIKAPSLPATPASPVTDRTSAAATLAQVLGGNTQTSPGASRTPATPPTPQEQRQFTPEVSDEEEQAPTLPQRPPSQIVSSPSVPQQARYTEPGPEAESSGVVHSPPYNRAIAQIEEDTPSVRSPGGYHLYNISEMISVMGRRKKMPTTFGLNIATGTIMLSPEKSRDGPTQEWTAEKLNHYSIEGKHVFVELIRPSKSLDLHAGAKDTAQEIVRALGEIAGAQKAKGFREVMAAASGGSSAVKKGVILYDFTAKADDEVTVVIGDEVLILDDMKSEEWWHVRRVKNDKEGVVPSSYIEVTGIASTEVSSRTTVNTGRSIVEQNRSDEEKMAKEAAKASRLQREAEAAKTLSTTLPQRASSLAEDESRREARKDKKSGRAEAKSRSKPDSHKTRTWTDHSGSFKVEAQFIGIADGKIHLHKVNGVKIAVPVSKMSPSDLEYVEKVIHESIEDHIPVADLIKLKRKSQAPESRAGASIQSPKIQVPEYDWFDFFLQAGVGPHQCERYAQAMVRDSMDESVLPDISTDSLRTLGLKEGDALKVMKYLDQKFNRTKTNGAVESGQGHIFSGSGGVLYNKTGRNRPDTNRATSDVVDPGVFDQGEPKQTPADTKYSPSTQTPARESAGGFEDDAWEVKPATKAVSASAQATSTVTTPKPLSETEQALSLLEKPLEPTPFATTVPAKQAQQTPQPPTTVAVPTIQPPQQTGANPAFFSQIGQQLPGALQFNQPRQRPQPPQQSFTASALLPPPPRPTSAAQNSQQNIFLQQSMQPQVAGIPQTAAQQAPPGQSLDEMTAQRMQQYQLTTQPTGYGQIYGSYSNNVQSSQTSYIPPQQQQPQQIHLQQPHLNGNTPVGFVDPRLTLQTQSTSLSLQPGPAPGSLNSVLPPALTPQRTGFQSSPPPGIMNGYNASVQPQPTGYALLQPQMTSYVQAIQPQPSGWGPPSQSNGYGSTSLPPIPPIPQNRSPAPLRPQKTGPAPDVRFGITEAKKLTPQPTGRRANLAAATPENPFGF